MNVGVCVATPAVPVPGSAVALWMCEAVVVPSRPEKVTCTRKVCAVLSNRTSPKPIPGEALGGLSAGPLRSATYRIMSA